VAERPNARDCKSLKPRVRITPVAPYKEHMTPHPVNEMDNFIAGWTPADTSICDRLIDYHKRSDHKRPGQIHGPANQQVKESTDAAILDSAVFGEYADYLQECLKEYIKLYYWVNEFDPWYIKEHINIQHYTPGQAYHAWHTERRDSSQPTTSRHLVFMTYLNDVDDQGETEWYYQKVKIKPERGLTVFWPTDWTFVHRGIASPSQEKYIATGWYSFK